MLSLPPSVRLFVARAPVDMRKSFDGLAGMARDVLHEDPLSGHLFVFFNKRKNRAKVLWWDRGGYFVLAKRLELGQFVIPDALLREGSSKISMTSAELLLILEGLDLNEARRMKRYSRPAQ